VIALHIASAEKIYVDRDGLAAAMGVETKNVRCSESFVDHLNTDRHYGKLWLVQCEKPARLCTLLQNLPSSSHHKLKKTASPHHSFSGDLGNAQKTRLSILRHVADSHQCHKHFGG